jgi:hypothetical protein
VGRFDLLGESPMSIAEVFGWPPTCAYADMPSPEIERSDSRREFVPRDP